MTQRLSALRPSLARLAAALLVALLPGLSRAVDGVLEIHQACALTGGCFAGDSAGFPVSINAAGSYRLTSNLTVSAAGVQGIRLFVDDVSIDLNGFTIQGPVVCSGLGSAISCSPAGVAPGINGQSRDRILVRNGRVRGFGSTGIDVGQRSRVMDVLVESNDGPGVSAGQYSILSGITARQNDGPGIFARSGSVLDRCVAVSNGGTGIVGGQGSSLVGLVSRDNGATGIEAGSLGVLRDASVQTNEAIGVNLGSGSVLSDTVIRSNGDDGILGAGASNIHHNVVTQNTGRGIDLTLGSSTAYRENTIDSNGMGTVAGGIGLGANACNGSTTCP